MNESDIHIYFVLVQQEMYPRVASSWIDPARDIALPELTPQQAELARGSTGVESKNFVVHLRMRPAVGGLFNPNVIWNAMREANASGKTSSYGAQLSMRIHHPDTDTTFTIMTSRDSADALVNDAVCEVCILGVKDITTTYIIAHYVTYDLCYVLTNVRFVMDSIKMCNTLFVITLPGVVIDIGSMARSLTAVSCIIHHHIEMVTITVLIEMGPGERDRVATCNVWTTGAINIMGVPNEECCRIALERILPLVVRFARVIDTPASAKLSPVPRSMHVPPLDKQFAWGAFAASRVSTQHAKVRLHPRTTFAPVPEALFMRPDLPLPLVTATQITNGPDKSRESDDDEGLFAD
jgi:hypothetical protein